MPFWRFLIAKIDEYNTQVQWRIEQELIVFNYYKNYRPRAKDIGVLALRIFILILSYFIYWSFIVSLSGYITISTPLFLLSAFTFLYLVANCLWTFGNTLSFFRRYSPVFLIVLMGFVSTASAAKAGAGTKAMDFIKLSHSVRAEAVGHALTAGQDMSSISINPASIALQSNPEFQIQNMSYIEGITFKSLNFVFPTDGGVFGLNAGYIDMGTQLRTTHTNKSGTGDYFSNYGSQISLVYANHFDLLNVGVAFKQISESLDSRSASALGLDFGANYSVSSSLSLGVALTNMTLKSAKFVAVSSDLPQSISVGGQYSQKVGDNDLLIMSDLVLPSDDNAYLGVGFDYFMNDFLSIRCGYRTYGDLGNLSLGLGLTLHQTTVDFSYKPAKDFGQYYKLGFGMKL